MMKPVWRNERTCLKPGIFFVNFFLLVFVYYSATISSIMTAVSVAVMDRRCTGECAASSLLIGACICDVGECESVNVSVNVIFFSTWNHDCVDMLLNLTYLIEVFGAGQLDVAAKAVSARFDTLWYSKGKVLNQVFNVVFAVHSCLQLFKLNAPVDTNHFWMTRFS